MSSLALEGWRDDGLLGSTVQGLPHGHAADDATELGEYPGRSHGHRAANLELPAEWQVGDDRVHRRVGEPGFSGVPLLDSRRRCIGSCDPDGRCGSVADRSPADDGDAD
jgi:hypothetical protein